MPEPAANDREALLGQWTGAGDREALDRLLRVELEPVKRAFRRRLGTRDRSPSLDTTDCVDEAVFRMLRLDELPDFDSPDGLRAYLTQAAVNLFHNHYRTAQRRPRHVTPDDLAALLRDEGARSLSKDMDLRELADMVLLAINLLDEEDALILDMHLLQGSPIREVADALSIPKSTIARRIARAKANLGMKMLSWREWVLT